MNRAFILPDLAFTATTCVEGGTSEEPKVCMSSCACLGPRSSEPHMRSDSQASRTVSRAYDVVALFLRILRYRRRQA